MRKSYPDKGVAGWYDKEGALRAKEGDVKLSGVTRGRLVVRPVGT